MEDIKLGLFTQWGVKGHLNANESGTHADVLIDEDAFVAGVFSVRNAASVRTIGRSLTRIHLEAQVEWHCQAEQLRRLEGGIDAQFAALRQQLDVNFVSVFGEVRASTAAAETHAALMREDCSSAKLAARDAAEASERLAVQAAGLAECCSAARHELSAARRGTELSQASLAAGLSSLASLQATLWTASPCSHNEAFAGMESWGPLKGIASEMSRIETPRLWPPPAVPASPPSVRAAAPLRTSPPRGQPVAATPADDAGGGLSPPLGASAATPRDASSPSAGPAGPPCDWSPPFEVRSSCPVHGGQSEWPPPSAGGGSPPALPASTAPNLCEVEVRAS